MKSALSRKAATLLLVLLAVAAVSVPILTSLAQDAEITKSKISTSPTPSLADIKKTFPSVEYSRDLETDQIRISKSSKYDGHKILYESAEDTDTVSSAHWMQTTTPLPISESQVVLLGKLSDSRAFLSTNRHYVYSEFKIEIERVFKNVSKAPIEEDKYIRAERDGGIVVFPTGFKHWLYVSGQRMPVVGERYLFFLSNYFPTSGKHDRDLYLLTAYRLKDGIVHPLDSPNGGTHPIATHYRGKNESILLADVEKALKENALSTSPDVSLP